MGDAVNVLRAEGLKFRITEIGGDYVTIRYKTLSGNNPSANGNYVAEWRAPYDEIPWRMEPEKTCNVNSTQAAGTFSMDNLELSDEGYIFGYSVVPLKSGVCNYCATAYLPSTTPLQSINVDSDIKYFDPGLEITSVNTDTVRIGYAMPSGYSPQDNGNWIGLWEGEPDVYHKQPDACVEVAKQVDTGTITISKIMKRETKYTVCYYGGGWDSDESKRSLSSPVYMVVFRV